MISWAQRPKTRGWSTLLILGLLFSVVVHATMDQKTKLEQLFLWKLSEELKLSVKEESALTEIITDLNQKRQNLSEKVHDQIQSMAKLKTGHDLETKMTEYRKLLKSQFDLNIEEIERVKKALGMEKLAQYLLVKSELSLKVKSLLLKPTQDGVKDTSDDRDSK